MDDNILRMYIDQVFTVYDNDRSGTLQVRELANFFNELFKSLNDTRRIDQNTINVVLSTTDTNKDGKITKPQLFILFKRILTTESHLLSEIPPQNNMQYQGQNYGNQPQYYGNQNYNYGNQMNGNNYR